MVSLRTAGVYVRWVREREMVVVYFNKMSKPSRTVYALGGAEEWRYPARARPERPLLLYVLLRSRCLLLVLLNQLPLLVLCTLFTLFTLFTLCTWGSDVNLSATALVLAMKSIPLNNCSMALARILSNCLLDTSPESTNALDHSLSSIEHLNVLTIG